MCGSDCALEQIVDVPRKRAERLVVAEKAVDIHDEEPPPGVIIVMQARWSKRLGGCASWVQRIDGVGRLGHAQMTFAQGNASHPRRLVSQMCALQAQVELDNDGRVQRSCMQVCAE